MALDLPDDEEARRLRPIRQNAAVQECFWNHVTKQPGGCWMWTGEQNPNGYGRFYLRGDGRKFLAHRFSYGLAHGFVERRTDLDHLCRTRLCVNPEHLE